MLDRLLNNRSSSSSSISHHPANSVAQDLKMTPITSELNSPILNSSIPHQHFGKYEHQNYDDAYTRTLLYGTPNHLPALPLDSNSCRIVVYQDGNIRSKQPLFDSAIQFTGSTILNQQQQQNINFKNLKMDNSRYHNLAELSDYIFGCGVPINEVSTSSKLQVLPSLPNTTNSILITRLFSLNQTFSNDMVIENNNRDLDLENVEKWLPNPTLKIGNPSNSGKNCTRFGIGIVLPINPDLIETVVTDNWEEYINFITSIETSTVRKLKALCSTNPKFCSNIQSCDSNKRSLCFPSLILQNDHELHQFLVGVIKLTHSISNIPRLLVGMKRSNTVILNWCHYVATWLQLKDGKNFGSSNLKFLASLFSILIPIRYNLLFNKPSDKKKEITRVVIMTGNPMVVQKLIFIISGILPDDVLVTKNHAYEEEILRSYELEENSESSSSPLTTMSNENKNHKEIGGNNNIKTNNRNEGKNLNLQDEIEKVNAEEDNDDSSSTNTPSVSSYSKGWEIPKTTSVSLATTSTPHASLTVIKPSSSCASLQCLSSSFSSSYNASSWKNHGLSVLEKWWTSNNNGNNNTNNYMTDSFNTNHHITNNVNNNNSKPGLSLSSVRTPSPATEYEDYSWIPSSLSNSPYTNHGGNNFSNFSNFYNNNQRLTKTTSQYDFSSVSNNINSKYSANTLSYLNRTATTLNSDCDNKTYQMVRDQCKAIMKSDPEIYIVENGENNNLVDVSLEDIFINEECKLGKKNFNDKPCPMSSNLDQVVLQAMRNDLQNHQLLKSSKPTTITKTIFVSLAAREIKEFTIKTTGTGTSTSTNTASGIATASASAAGTTTPSSSSQHSALSAALGRAKRGTTASSGSSSNGGLVSSNPTNDQLANHNNNNNNYSESFNWNLSNSFKNVNRSNTNLDSSIHYSNNSTPDPKTTVRKLFSPKKNCIDDNYVLKIDRILDKIIDTAKKINNNNNNNKNNTTTTTTYESTEQEAKKASADLELDTFKSIRHLINIMFEAGNQENTA
ncbi:hypothetical protein PACTADRAFT_51425 [Pachysolen tannophilus NRRL Y-2460]|uniref:Protein LST4 n=1 Tax=Pachysolen tannophilus NRRL Y-2460 TaxID=669874 RepID=A0A1E4TPH7_PACTA|nr:hypothetical protein PACTADRAFT_51425 [Pachysolen tannophilus NRRL Y-2460]